MWLMRQTIGAAAVGEDGVLRPRPTRNRVELHILPMSLVGLGPCAVMDFLAEAANKQDLSHTCRKGSNNHTISPSLA